MRGWPKKTPATLLNHPPLPWVGRNSLYASCPQNGVHSLKPSWGPPGLLHFLIIPSGIFTLPHVQIHPTFGKKGHLILPALNHQGLPRFLVTVCGDVSGAVLIWGHSLCLWPWALLFPSISSFSLFCISPRALQWFSPASSLSCFAFWSSPPWALAALPSLSQDSFMLRPSTFQTFPHAFQLLQDFNCHLFPFVIHCCSWWLRIHLQRKLLWYLTCALSGRL